MFDWKHCEDQQKEDYFLFISKALALEQFQQFTKSNALHECQFLACVKTNASS